MPKTRQLILMIILGAVLLMLANMAAVLPQRPPSFDGTASLAEMEPTAGSQPQSCPLVEDTLQDAANSLYTAGQELEEVSVLYQYSSKGALAANDYPDLSKATNGISIEYTIDITLPYLSVDSSDVEAVNQEIQEHFASAITMKNDSSLLLEQKSAPLQYYYVRYFVAQTPRTVSLVLCSTISDAVNETTNDCSIYSFDRKNWQRISPNELLSLNGKDVELTAKMYEQRNSVPSLKNPKCPDYYMDGNDVWGLFPQEYGVSRVKLTTDQQADQQYLSILDRLLKRHSYLTDQLFSGQELIHIPEKTAYDPNLYYQVTSAEFSNLSTFLTYAQDTYSFTFNDYFPIHPYLRSLSEKDPPLYEKDGHLYICKARSPQYADHARVDFTDYSAKILDFVDDNVFFQVSLYQTNGEQRTLVNKTIVITNESGVWKISRILS